MRIMIVTDAWEPQVNGVVRTIKSTRRELESMGHAVDILSPLEFKTLPCPTYPDIRLSLGATRQAHRRIEAFNPDALHIATEGPLGLAARRWAIKHNFPYTTAYHTRFPEYVHARFRVPVGGSPQRGVRSPGPEIRAHRVDLRQLRGRKPARRRAHRVQQPDHLRARIRLYRRQPRHRAAQFRRIDHPVHGVRQFHRKVREGQIVPSGHFCSRQPHEGA